MEHKISSVIDDVMITDSAQQRAAHRIAEAMAVGPKGKCWNILKGRVGDLPPHMPTVLSSERMFRYLCTPQKEKRRVAIAKNIKAILGRDVRFILYVRSFGSYFNSLVSERIIATQESRPISEVVESLCHLADVQSTSRVLQSEFGPGSVSVFSFDAALMEPGGLLGHFARVVGWEAVDAIKYPSNRLHSMPPENFLALKYRINGMQLTDRIYQLLRRQIGRLALRHGPIRSFRIINNEAIDRAIEIGRRLNPELLTLPGISEEVLFSTALKSKVYVDLEKPNIEGMLSALVELYQMSSLRDMALVKLFNAAATSGDEDGIGATLTN